MLLFTAAAVRAEVTTMTALTELVEALKRELAVPGVYDDVFPDTDNTQLAAALADAFAEAQLNGFFTTLTLGEAPDYETSEDISAAAGALVLLFASMRILRAWLRSISTNERYKAGPVEYETARSTNLLRDELAYLRARIDALILGAQRSQRAALSVHVLDSYWSRVSDPLGITGGFFPNELGR